MSMISDRLLRAAAVLIAGAILLWSAVVTHDLKHLVPETTTPEQIKAVHDGQAILRGLTRPVGNIQPCDAIKSLFPDHFDRDVGNTNMRADFDKPVILCFRNSIDYGDALAAADKRKLIWSTGLGGDTIVAFAPNEEIFRAVMASNGVKLEPGDMTPWSPNMDGLRGENGAKRVDGDMVIMPRTDRTEVLFGPYIQVSGGRHRVEFVFAPVHPADCVAMRQEKAWLIVSYQNRIKVLQDAAEQRLQPVPGPGCRYRLAVDFTAPAEGLQQVETPLWVQGFAQMKVQNYAVIQIGPAAPTSAPAP